MKKYTEILLILVSLLLFILAGISSYYIWGNKLIYLSIFGFPFLVALYYSMKDIESKRLKRILWKMPLLSILGYVIIAIFIFLFTSLGAHSGNCNGEGCAFLGISLIFILLCCFFIEIVVTFVIALIIYFVKKE